MANNNTNSEIASASVLKRFLAYFSVLLVLTLLIASGFIYRENKFDTEMLLANERQTVEMLRRISLDNIKTIVADLMFLSSLPELHQVMNSYDQESRAKLAQVFLDFHRTHSIYDQVRFLDKTGIEVVRTNAGPNQPFIVSEEELQNKAQRYYFADIIELDPGIIFMSPFDLNVELDQIEQPLKSVIRFGTPLVDHNRMKQGIVILNFLGETLIQDLIDGYSMSASIGKLVVLNSDGYWLKGSSSEDEWGFMFPDRVDRTLAGVDPEAWHELEVNNQGQFRNDLGVYTYTSVLPLGNDMVGSTGSGSAYKSSRELLTGGEYQWKIVTFVPEGVLRVRFRSLLQRWFLFYGFLMLVVAFMVWRQAENVVRKEAAEVEKERLIKELTTALSDVKQLSGMLPICSNCKKIRDDEGYWQNVESYIGAHSEALFSHGICPDCIKKLYPDMEIARNI